MKAPSTLKRQSTGLVGVEGSVQDVLVGTQPGNHISARALEHIPRRSMQDRREGGSDGGPFRRGCFALGSAVGSA